MGQTGLYKGQIVDEQNEGILAVNIALKPSDNQRSDTYVAVSSVEGFFEVAVPEGSYEAIFSHVQYWPFVQPVVVVANETVEGKIVMQPNSTQLKEVTVEGKATKDAIDPATKIDRKAAQAMPSATGDFSKVLLTLPGVAGNNELSSAYNVRGGNFDENLVYVNDIPVYRPFLSNAGRQEGLSFVNPDLVDDISFFAGGWEAKYGDKLSSSLNIEYKEPNELEGRLTMGLLGGSVYLGDQVNTRFKYLVGMRHSNTKYLLNTLETSGQYLPSYTDAQALLTFDLSKAGAQINKTKLNWLLSYARNRYLTLPESQTTEFGSVSVNLRIETAFEGREELDYDTYQTGFNLSHRWSNRLLSRWIVSGVRTLEREYFNVEGAYRICDVDNDPGSSDFNECVVTRGVGTNFDYGRNRLEATLLNAEWRNEWLASDWTVLEAGVGIALNDVADDLNEYAFLDSAGIVDFDDIESTFNSLDLSTSNTTAFVQGTIFSKDSIHALNAGVRVNYLDYNQELLVSPRLVYRFKPRWERETSFRASIGQYSQPPFYRELRDLSGNIQGNVKGQKSYHFIAAMEYLLDWWQRPFLFTVEGYFKDQWDVIPYDIDNVRLRYFANNDAIAYAYGIDFRLNGEFIKGSQSWFSLGLLNTKEDIAEDDRGYIRRPSDQHVNLAFYFEDHYPNDPSLRVYVNWVFGSGYPLGPPNDINARNSLAGDEYFRLDLGLSKSFLKGDHWTFMVRAELLNALGADNTLSYSWIQDVTGAQLAIPNSLSARFLNIKISAAF